MIPHSRRRNATGGTSSVRPSGHGRFSRYAIDTEEKLRSLIGERACEAGADLLITTRSNDLYMKAVAIRWNPDADPTP